MAAVLDDALLALVVHVDQPEPRFETIRPLKVVHQGPAEVPVDGYSAFPRLLDLGQVRFVVGDPPIVMDPVTDQLVGEGSPTFGHHDARIPAVGMHHVQDESESLRADLPTHRGLFQVWVVAESWDGPQPGDGPERGPQPCVVLHPEEVEVHLAAFEVAVLDVAAHHAQDRSVLDRVTEPEAGFEEGPVEHGVRGTFGALGELRTGARTEGG